MQEEEGERLRAGAEHQVIRVSSGGSREGAFKIKQEVQTQRWAGGDKMQKQWRGKVKLRRFDTKIIKPWHSFIGFILQIRKFFFCALI